MNYKDTKETMMKAYPSLFPYEWCVLNHLFFVIGNGYSWINGQLTDGCEDPLEIIKQARNSAINHAEQQIEFDKSDCSFWVKYKELQYKPIEEQWEYEINKRKEYLNDGEGTDCWFLCDDGMVGTYIYPLCEYARILHIPNDVQADWLEAAEYSLSLIGSRFRTKTIKDEEWLAKIKDYVKNCRENIKELK